MSETGASFTSLVPTHYIMLLALSGTSLAQGKGKGNDKTDKAQAAEHKVHKDRSDREKGKDDDARDARTARVNSGTRGRSDDVNRGPVTEGPFFSAPCRVRRRHRREAGHP